MRPFEPLRDRVVPEASGRVLEVGCGTGLNFARYDPRRVSEVVAIEPDPHMRRRAEARVESASVPIVVVDADAQRLPFDDASFDEIVLTFTLCTIPEPARAAAEMRRVLRPGGALRFVEHTLADGAVMAATQRLLTPMWSRLAGGCHLDRDATALLRAAGFTIDERHGHGRGAFNLAPVHRGVAR